MPCVAITAKGDPCRFKTTPDAVYCPNHDPKNAKSLANQNIVNASKPRRPESRNLLNASFALTDRTAIQAALDTALRLQLCGRLSDARARTILRYLRAASVNFEPVSTGGSARHEWHTYFQRVEGLLSTIDPLLDELVATDAANEAGERDW